MAQSFVRTLLLLLVLSLSLPAPLAAATDSARPPGESCPLSMDVNMKEHDAIVMFHARLSHLRNHWGRPSFEPKLQDIIREHWPKRPGIELSPTFWERVLNQVDQARVTDSVVKVLGPEHEDWNKFERHMTHVTLLNSTAGDLRNPLEKVSVRLMHSIADQKRFPLPKGVSKEDRDLRIVEAIARVSEMYAYLNRWRIINRGIIDERAAASSRKVAIIGIGLIGAGVVASTIYVSGPVMAGAGSAAAGLSSNPVVAGLLAQLAQTAAGGILGAVGAPGALAVRDSYRVLSEGKKNSLNGQTVLSCELAKQIDHWKSEAGPHYLEAAIHGGLLGVAGGTLALSEGTAQVLLYVSGFGVGVAQVYAAGKLAQESAEALYLYRMAEEAEAAGDHERALEYLHEARNLAQAAGDTALETILVAVATAQVGMHFQHALHEGRDAIRLLYVHAAEALPVAKDAGELVWEKAMGASELPARAHH